MKLTKRQYLKQAAQCTHRKDRLGNQIEMKLTFEEWKQIWEESGHAHERGRGKNKYCMARIDDLGHYEVGNVKIITMSENSREMAMRQLGTKRGPQTPEHRAAISAACKGRPGTMFKGDFTPEHRAKIGESVRRTYALSKAKQPE